ncbi:MAG: 16S rRNA (guanine(966)-N(2))-methyltransferase RsmD [Tissierellaceae bacterium]
MILISCRGVVLLRVISGISKGHKLKAPKGISTRPTEDRIKESLFNIIGHIHPSSVILDLFGGSGSIGIEFLSRGAEICYFIDVAPSSISTIRENLVHTKLIDRAKLYKMDGIKAVEYFGGKCITFDYIYLDPPFGHREFLLDVLKSISDNLILSPGGILIIEHEKELTLEDNLFEFEKSDIRRYGNKSITFLRKSIH